MSEWMQLAHEHHSRKNRCIPESQRNSYNCKDRNCLLYLCGTQDRNYELHPPGWWNWNPQRSRDSQNHTANMWQFQASSVLNFFLFYIWETLSNFSFNHFLSSSPLLYANLWVIFCKFFYSNLLWDFSNLKRNLKNTMTDHMLGHKTSFNKFKEI